MSSIIKVIIAPFIGFLLLDIFGLDKHQAMITLIFWVFQLLVHHILWQKFLSDAALAGRIIALSTLLSFYTAIVNYTFELRKTKINKFMNRKQNLTIICITIYNIVAACVASIKQIEKEKR